VSRLAGRSSREGVIPSDVSDEHVAGLLDALPTRLKSGADGLWDPELDTGLRLFMVPSLVGAGSVWMGSFGAPVRREPHVAEPGRVG
jgi:hypothetical protein